MKQITRSIGLLLIMAATTQAAVIVPLPPFTVYGKLRSWNGRAISSSDAATVIAKVKGVEVNRCDVKSGISPTLNYRVQIPMASGSVAGRGEVGDPITFEVYYDGQIHAVAAGKQALSVIKPAGSIACDLVMGTDSDGDGLPDEYEALLMYYYGLAGRGSSLEDIKPSDDLDGDGYSNLQEFLAGTIPVLSEDYLKITQFFLMANGSMALSFLSAPGRTYTLPKSTNVSSNSWGTAEFARTSSELPAENFFNSEVDANVTLYVLPSTNTSTFYRLEVQ